MAERVKWRRAVNKWNIKDPPWSGAIGIEEDNDFCVPALVCWFTRGHDDIDALVQEVVDDHNARVKQAA